MRRPETSYIESEVREIAEARTRATNSRTMHQTKQGASDKSRSSRSIIINNKNRNSRSKEMAPLQLGPSNARVVTRCNNTASPFATLWLSFFCTPMLFKALWDVPLFVAEPRFRNDERAIQTPMRGQISDRDLRTSCRSLGNGLVGERSKLEAEARKLKREIRNIKVRCVTTRIFNPPFPSKRTGHCIVCCMRDYDIRSGLLS